MGDDSGGPDQGVMTIGKDLGMSCEPEGPFDIARPGDNACPRIRVESPGDLTYLDVGSCIPEIPGHIISKSGLRIRWDGFPVPVLVILPRPTFRRPPIGTPGVMDRRGPRSPGGCPVRLSSDSLRSLDRRCLLPLRPGRRRPGFVLDAISRSSLPGSGPPGQLRGRPYPIPPAVPRPA